MSEVVRDSGSFRDPEGFVFKRDGELFRHLSDRSVSLVNQDDWQQLTSNLIEKGLLSYFVIEGREMKMEAVPWISYPYEWSPRQLRAAALLTLDLQLECLRSGFSLKDASAFNVQFNGSKPIFIDQLSIEPDSGETWSGYRQFIEHFYAPLVLAAFVEPSLARDLWVGISGIPIPTAARVLGNRGRWNLGVQIHIHQLAKRLAPAREVSNAKAVMQPMAQRVAILEQLRESIVSLKLDVAESDWGDYYAKTNYSPEAAETKAGLVRSWLKEAKPLKVVDLGANDGKFAAIASEEGATALALEFDLQLVNRTFDRASHTTLCVDLACFDAGRGWEGEERPSLFKRAFSDCVLALAIIHHLVFTSQVPLEKVVHLISLFGADAVIEWIEPEDSYAQRLIHGRSTGLLPYSRDVFEEAVSISYDSYDSVPIEGTLRTLYFCRGSVAARTKSA